MRSRFSASFYRENPPRTGKVYYFLKFNIPGPRSSTNIAAEAVCKVKRKMILSKKEILEEIRKGTLKITPFDKNKIGECSVDLTLGNEFRILKKQNKTINVTENSFLNEKQTKRIVLKKNERITLKPNELVLGITNETIRMPFHLCGWIQGRSRFARLGLLVHISSSLIQPGVENKQVLEIVNLSPTRLSLSAGLPVCQVVFERLSSPERHHGVFARQTKI